MMGVMQVSQWILPAPLFHRTIWRPRQWDDHRLAQGPNWVTLLSSRDGRWDCSQRKIQGKVMRRGLGLGTSWGSWGGGLPWAVGPQPGHDSQAGPAQIPDWYCPGRAPGRWHGYDGGTTPGPAQAVVMDFPSIERSTPTGRDTTTWPPVDQKHSSTNGSPSRKDRGAICPVTDNASVFAVSATRENNCRDYGLLSFLLPQQPRDAIIRWGGGSCHQVRASQTQAGGSVPNSGRRLISVSSWNCSLLVPYNRSHSGIIWHTLSRCRSWQITTCGHQCSTLTTHIYSCRHGFRWGSDSTHLAMLHLWPKLAKIDLPHPGPARTGNP